MNQVNPKKLLQTKWTAATPERREKHFIVTAVVEPDAPGAPIESIVLEAVATGASRAIAWRSLRDSAVWRQGWV